MRSNTLPKAELTTALAVPESALEPAQFSRLPNSYVGSPLLWLQLGPTVGIDLATIFTLAIALGTGLAGLAGALIAPLFNVYPAVGFAFTVKAFAITILGGSAILSARCWRVF